jgi:hypothetical protein
MSIWIKRRSKTGGSSIYLVDFPYFLLFQVVFVILISLFLYVLIHTPFETAVGALSAMILGGVMIAAAKVSLFRRGIWISWGPSRMKKRFAAIYATGYLLIVVGAAALAIVEKATR